MSFLLILSATIAAIGMSCILLRQTLFGVVLGVQLLFTGAGLMILLAGVFSGARVEAHLAALFVVLGCVAVLAVGCALSLRMLAERNRIRMDELRALKR